MGAKLERTGKEADLLLSSTRTLDPLDWCTSSQRENSCAIWQTQLDLAHDYARSSCDRSIDLLQHARRRQTIFPDQSLGAWPLVQYTLAGGVRKRDKKAA